MDGLPALFEGARWHSFNTWLARRWPHRVFKLGLDAGFTCPNIDGTVATGGCTFCLNESFSPNSRGAPRPIAAQVRDGMKFYRRRYRAEKFIVYFQAHTNTHGEVAHLRRLYDEATAFDDVVGLAIGTRPDCVPDPVLDLISEYGERLDVWIEYGLQTKHEQTQVLVNRGHGWDAYVDAIERTRGRPMKVCTHLILGLPGEDAAMARETADAVAGLGLDAVKIHHCYVSPGTPLALDWRAGSYRAMDLDDWLAQVCDVLERMPENVVVQRAMGELSGPFVLAPLWGKNKQELLAAVEAELARRGTWQGAHAEGGDRRRRPESRLRRAAGGSS